MSSNDAIELTELNGPVDSNNDLPQKTNDGGPSRMHELGLPPGPLTKEAP